VEGSVNRRTFAKTLLAGLGATGLLEGTASVARATAAPRQNSPGKQLRIGCTALVWNVFPRSPEPLETAVRDMSELGYKGFETFGEVIEDWDKKGALEKSLNIKRDLRVVLQDIQIQNLSSGGATASYKQTESFVDPTGQSREFTTSMKQTFRVVGGRVELEK